MKVKKGYKKNKYGIIPDEWVIIRIQKLIDQNIITDHLDGNHGALYPKSHEFKSDGVPYVSANDFINGRVNFSTVKYLSEERASLFQKGVSKNGDVLFAHNATVGPVALLETKLSYIVLSTTATYFRCDSKKLSNLYLLYILQSAFFVKQYSAVMSQSTRNQVPITAQRKFYLPLPPLPEQKAIAKVLSDTDALIQGLEKLIAKKRLIKQGAMQDLLRPKEGWEEDKIKNITAITTGSKNTQDKINNGIYPFFVRSQTIEKINTYSFEGEAVLTAGDGVGTGKVFHYINGKFDFHQRVYKISDFNKKLNGYYFYLYFSNNFYDRIMQMTAKSSVDSVRMEMIADMIIPLPSLQEQIQIANILSDMDEEIEKLEIKLAKYRQVKQGMMQQLLTGQVRLV